MVETEFNVVIGSTPTVYPTFDSDTDVPFELATGTYTQASAMTTTGITQPIQSPLPEVGSLHVPLLRRGSDDPEETSFTHTIDSVGRDGLNKTTITSYGLERKLHQTTITASYTNAPAEEIIEAACEKANISPLPGGAFPSVEEFADQQGPRIPEAEAEVQNRRVTADYQDVPAISVIDETCRSQGWEWRITNSILWYGEQSAAKGIPRDPDILRTQDIPRERRIALQTAPATYQLRWIKTDETNPTQQEYPFDTLRVFGKPTVITSSGAPQPIREPTVAQMQVGPDGESNSPVQGVVGRVHVYRDDRIVTQQQANRVAISLWKELERQAQSGPIRTVGDPRPEPLDRVVMPDELGGTNHLVKSVLHTIDATDGWTTQITTGGQPNFDAMPDINNDPDLSAGTVVSESDAQEDSGGA